MFAFIPAVVASLVVGQHSVPRTDEEGRAYFQRLYDDRAKITGGYVEFSVAFDHYPRWKVLEGNVRTYRYWYDKERLRIDVKDVRPNQPDQGIDSRYAFSDGVHRMIDIDRPNVVVKELTSAYLKGKEPPFGPKATGNQVDLRQLGIFNLSFGLMHHHQLDEFKPPKPDARITVRRVPGEESASDVVVSFADWRVTTYRVTAASILPVAITTEVDRVDPASGRRYQARLEIRSEVVAMPNSRGERFDYPRRLTFRQVVNGELEKEETVTVREANFNVPVNPDDLTWKALRPAVGASLEYNGRWMRTNETDVTWDGERFKSGPAPPLQVLPN